MTTQTTATQGRNFQFGTDISNTVSNDDALATAGLDWDLRLAKAENMTILEDGGVTTTSIPGYRLVLRNDNHVALGAVGGKYHLVSNRDAFAIGDSLVERGARRTRAGEFDHGRRVFMEFDFPQHHVGLANGKDLVTFGARITSSHDGSGKVVAGIVGKRLYCMNGCTVAMKGLPHVYKVSHTATAADRLAQASQIMEGAGRYVAAFTGAAERLLTTPMNRREFGAYVDALFPRPADDAAKATRTRWENQRDELFKLYSFAATNELGRNTRWAGFNAVTEYLDWGSQVRTGSRAADVQQARALRQFDNANQETRDAAWRFALAA